MAGGPSPKTTSQLRSAGSPMVRTQRTGLDTVGVERHRGHRLNRDLRDPGELALGKARHKLPEGLRPVVAAEAQVPVVVHVLLAQGDRLDAAVGTEAGVLPLWLAPVRSVGLRDWLPHRDG